MTVTLSPQNVIEAVKSSSESSSGCRQVFIKLTDNWAIKIFKEEEHGEYAEEMRDETYEKQETAASFSLGPDVGDKIDLGDGDFGYITEIVPLFNHYLSSNGFTQPWINGAKNVYMDDYDDFLRWVHQYEIRELIDLLRDLADYYFSDHHGGNMGWKDGKLVCIDFC
jgi:hypothetical protein